MRVSLQEHTTSLLDQAPVRGLCDRDRHSQQGKGKTLIPLAIAISLHPKKYSGRLIKLLHNGKLDASVALPLLHAAVGMLLKF